MKSRVTLITILLVFCFVLIPLLISCIHTSGAAYIKEVGFEEHQHLLVVSNPVLTAGNFHCLDVTLTDDAHKISIVAYLGSEVPDVENRSIKNYYRWEYDNGKWQDKSGYESFYIRPSQCKKNGHTYSFYIGLDARADTGDWTIKISVDNKDVYSSPLNVETIHFNILLFTICNEGFKSDKNDLPEFFKKHRKINYQEQTVTNKESLDDIEAFIDHFLGARSSVSQIKAFAIPVKKTPLYDELVDKLIKDHSSAQETDEDEEIENYYEVEKTVVVDSSLKVSTKKGAIPPPVGKIYRSSVFRGGVPILVAFLLISLAFIPLITSSDDSIDSNSPVISGFTLSPDRVVDGDTIFLNVSTYNSVGISSVTADMGGIEAMQLSLIDNSTSDHLWQAVWTVHDANPGDYFATITALDNESNSYSTQLEWTVLSQDSDEEGSSDTNQTETTNEEDSNTTTDVSDFENEINSGNDTLTNETDGSLDNDTFIGENETVVSTGLSIVLEVDKSVYFVNETVVIQGNVSYNGSLVNTSANVVVNGPSYNSSVVLNVADGVFSYGFDPSNVGNYSAQAVVFYENESVEEYLMFYVQSMPLNVTNLSSGDVISVSGCVNITAFEAKTMIDSEEDVIVLDVRSSEEYSSGYIDGAISAPLIDLSCESCLQEMLDEHKNDSVIVYGNDSFESTLACTILLENGFTVAYCLVGGINGWRDAGFSATVSSDEDDEESIYGQVDQSLKDGRPVLLYFYRDLCGICQDQKPILDELGETYSDRIIFIYVERADDPDSVEGFGVTGYPTMFLIVDKDEDSYIYKDFSGFTDRDTLVGFFDIVLYSNDSSVFDGWWHGTIEPHRPLDLPLKVAARISHDEDVQVIIKYKDGSNFSEVTAFLESVGFVKTAEIPSKRFVAGIMDPMVYENIKYDSDILAVYPDINFTVFLNESLPLIRYDEAVDEFGVTGSGKRICILDTGVDSSLVNYSHGYDFVNDDPIPDDECGHGTKVAAIIKSVAPDAELIVAKVIGGDGVGYESDVLEALQWCIDQNPDVISFSIGSQGSCDGFCDGNFVASMSNDAVDGGIFVVAASGNDGNSSLKSPACGSKVFSVGATDDFDNIAGFSNVNPILDMFAPGVDIETVAGGGSGTSFSAPHVAGAALLVLENENLTPASLKYRLRSTGKPIDYTYNETLSLEIGRLDVYNALGNNTTMEPYNYSWWWQDNLSEEEEFEILDTVTYYFDTMDQNERWATNPGNMVDENENTYAFTTSDGDIELLTGNTCPGTDPGAIAKVEIRCKGYYGGEFGSPPRDILLRPVFSAGDGDNHVFTLSTSAAWSSWYDITTDTNAPTWTWSAVDDLDCDVEADIGGGWTLYCSKVEIRVTYNLVYLLPDDDGDVQEWDYYAPTERPHWQCVDDPVGSPNEDADYVYTDVENEIEEFNHTTSALLEGVIITNVRVNIRAKVQYVPNHINIGVKVEGTRYGAAADTLLTGFYADYYKDWANNPADSQSWEKSDIDDLQSSLQSKAFDVWVNVTQVYLTVTYTSSDTTPPAITTLFAGNLGDSGGPYWQPPGETTQLTGTYSDGYYTNDSRQNEDWMYIVAEVTDTGGVVDTVKLCWYNQSSDSWDNTTEFAPTMSATIWVVNTSGNITVSEGHNYSFNIWANDTNNNINITWWNKTGLGGSFTRRYVQLDCAQTNISYTPFYCYNATYGSGDANKEDRLHHDQGAEGTLTDTGYLTATELTDTVSLRSCSSFLGYWFEDSTCIEPFTIDNIYYHFWWATDTDQMTYVGYNYSREDLSYPKAGDYYSTSSANNRSSIYYDNKLPSYSNNYYLEADLFTVSGPSFTDNNMYELAISFLETPKDPSVISNRSFTSFVLFNVPDNETLNASYLDSDSDSLSDWTELYKTYTNPFLADTDNDGVSDYYENLSGSDPNNWTSTIQNPPTITGEHPANQSTEVSTTPVLNVTVDDCEEDTLNAYWYSNSSSAWVLFDTNTSIDTSGGPINISQTNSNFSAYSTIYYWSVNLTDGTDWTNETYHFTTVANNPPEIGTPTTDNETVGYGYNVTINVSVWDNDTGVSQVKCNVTYPDNTWYNFTMDNIGWADDWLGISSAELNSFCGEFDFPGYKLIDALDGNGYWTHLESEVHWFVLDLGDTYTIKKVRGRSLQAGYDPTDVNIYIDDSNPPTTLVHEGITTWKDTDQWVEIDITDSNGRYIKVEIEATEEGSPGDILFGGVTPFTIFDAYGDVAAPPAGYYEKEINLTDTWQLGWHNYTIWATDGTNGNTSSQYSFNVSAQCNVTVQTEKDSYGANEYVNLTDPPDTIGDNSVGDKPFDNTEWTVIERGANFVRRQNIANPNLFSWESAPQWVYNGTAWVPYIFDETVDYYQVQSGLVGTRIYKSGYAEFWNPGMTEVRLYEETWILEYYDSKKDQWKVCDVYSPTFVVDSDITTVNITASFITDFPNSGERSFDVKYIFKEGRPLKHEITFTSHSTEEYLFRMKQRWAGIVGDKVKHSNGTDTITSPTTVNSSWFKFQKADGSLNIFENQRDMYYGYNETTHRYYILDDQNLKPVEIDVHAQGLKADFVFGNWTLSQDESLTIDPDTATLDDPTEDGFIEWDGYEYYRVDEYSYIYFGSVGDYGEWMWDDRAYVEWDISSLAGATLTANPAFKYEGVWDDATDEVINPITEEQPSSGGCTDEELYGYIASGITYYFNSFEFSDWDYPEDMVDGNLETFAETFADYLQVNDANTCPGDDLGTITKVELRFHGYADEVLSEDTEIILIPFFDGEEYGEEYSEVLTTNPSWSSYFDITTDLYAPSPWTWADVQNLDVFVLSGYDDTMYFCSKVEIKVTLGEAYVDPFDFQVGENEEADLGVTAKSDLQSAMDASQSWFAIGFQSPADEGEINEDLISVFCSEEQDPAPTPKPTLYVEYTPAGPPPNNAPTQSNQKIWNATTKVEKSLNATAVDLYPTSFNVTINDADGDKMNITILTNATGTWTVVNQTSNSGLSNGTYSYYNTSWVNARTTYYISFNLTDGTDWCNETYHFTAYTESKIDNVGTTNCKGYLLMQIHYNDSGSWYTVESTIDETSTRTINAGNHLKLDVIFNGTVYTSTNLTNGTGEYRVYAAFRDKFGSVLKNDDDTYMNASYAFNYTAVLIDTSVDTITPYEQTTSPLTINATSTGTTPDNVTLWYRYSTDNSSWANDTNWWNPYWTYRKKLTIDHNQVAATLTNFPILVSITDTDLISTTQDDADDIVFTNATGTKLNHEIEKYDSSTGELVAWVNVTSLSGSSDTEIYMYYGNSTCSSQQNPTGVWDSNFKGVWHKDDLTTSTIEDSTSNSNDGTKKGANEPIEADGQIYKAQDYDGDEYIGCGQGASLNVIGDITVSIWLKTSSEAGGHLVHKYRLTSPYNGYGLMLSDPNVRFFDGTSWRDDTTTVNDGSWHHIVFVGSGTTGQFYVDGDAKATTGFAAIPDNSGYSLTLGSHYNVDSGFLTGIMDEVRVSNTARSAAWINTTYNTTNSPSTFLSTSSEESWMQWTGGTNPDDDSPWSWEFDFPNSTGYYEFYSIGNKTGSVNETAPSSADAMCHYTALINTSVDTITPYEQTTSPLTINATSTGTTPDNVTLWYRYSTDNSSWANDTNWWNPYWTYRKKLTIDHNQVAATLTNFPILVSITDTDLISTTQDDADDIVFTNATGTKLNHEIEKYDSSTGELVAWVNVTSLSGSSDTEIYMYYGNSTCGSQQNVAGTWDSNYVGVWHLNDNTTSDILDSTSNNNDGAKTGANQPEEVDGKIGKCQDFDKDPDDEYIALPDMGTVESYPFTFEVWVKTTQVDGCIVSQQNSGVATTRVQIYVQGGTYLYYNVRSNAEVEIGPSGYADGNWYYVAGVSSASNDHKVYVNGTFYDSSSTDVNAPSVNIANIGWRMAGTGFDGLIDEVRISNIDRNASWINTTYNTTNSPSAFLSTSSEESWMKYTGDTNPDLSSPWQWSFNFPNDTGYYEFYSIGKKSGSTDETPPSSADARCHYTALINTSVDTITPYEQTTSPLTINATSTGATPDNVTLWYRYSTDNSSWANDTNWWNAYWTYRKKLTIDHNQVAATLTNFPILVSITDTDLSSAAQDDGDDIVFTNATGTKLNHEIEKYDSSTGELVAWVNVTSLSGSSDTEIYMYYGNSSCSSQENVAGTWEGNYVAVWHMNASSNSDQYDSSGRGHTLTANGTPTSNIDGKIGKSITFDGTNDYFTHANHADFNFGAGDFTLAIWGEPTADAESDWRGLMYKGSATCRYNFVGIRKNAPVGGSHIEIDDDSTDKQVNNDLDTSDGNWHFYVVVRENDALGAGHDELRLKADSTLETLDIGDYGNIDQVDKQFALGSDSDGNGKWKGDIDEVRISKIAHNQSWINTTYNTTNNADTFLSTGSEEAWMQWSGTNPDENSPWSWEFDLPNDTGYYEFYSIGKKTGSTDETAPNTKDASCYYRGNTAPEISNPYPSNGSTDISVTPTLNITVNDADGDSMTITWYSNSSGSWQVFGTNTSCSNGTYHMSNNNFSNYSITYYWNVSVNDGTDTNNSGIYHFTTEAINTSVDTISPYEVTASSLTVTASAEHDNYDNVTLWYRWSDDNSSWDGGGAGASENWWDTSWLKRRPIYLNTSGVITEKNHTCMINISYDSEMNNNFSDIRFIQYADNTTELDYWIQKKVDGSYAWVWIEPRDNITSVNQTLTWLYYNNSNANNNSNGTNTFQYFNDFETQSTGWSTSAERTATAKYEGSYSLHTSSATNNPYYTTTKYQNCIIESKAMKTGIRQGLMGRIWGESGSGYLLFNKETSYILVYDFNDSAYVNDTESMTDPADGAWWNWKFGINGTTQLKGKAWIDGGSEPDWMVEDTDGTITNGYVGVYGFETTAYYDLFRVRKYIEDEPSYFISSEETYSAGSGNGYNWSAYGTDAASPWSWEFDFPNSTGYYEFYSIGKKSGSTDETAPGSADARCHYTVAVSNVAPVINSYDLLNITGSKLNSLTGLLDVNNEYYFTVNITDGDGWADIEYINITAWYDQNDDAGSSYNSTSGGNLNMFLQYKNTTGPAVWSLKWPDDEVELVVGNCSETVINSTTRIINISFKPKSQVRYANTTGGWDTNPGWNDTNSWNFEINVTDQNSASDTERDEYGVYKYTFIEPSQNWVGVIAIPGENDTSDVVAVTYSSNYDFNMTIWFEENLANQTRGTTILIANNVDILNDTDPNDDIDTGDITFNGIGEVNAIDIFNTSGIFSKNNVSQTVDVQFNVRIPLGTMWGEYIAHIGVKIIQKT